MRKESIEIVYFPVLCLGIRAMDAVVSAALDGMDAVVSAALAWSFCTAKTPKSTIAMDGAALDGMDAVVSAALAWSFCCAKTPKSTIAMDGDCGRLTHSHFFAHG